MTTPTTTPTTAAPGEGTPLLHSELVPTARTGGGDTFPLLDPDASKPDIGGGGGRGTTGGAAGAGGEDDPRSALFAFLEASTPAGRAYETFTVFLILLSVTTFVLASLYVPEYNDAPVARTCGSLCDAVWFGNYSDNALSWLGIGATSVVEIFAVAVFSADYASRIWTADLLDPRYAGFVGRLRFMPTFFSLVDLASTVPFYVDAFLLPNTDLAASTFLRMFRLLRMMKVEGRYDLALGMIDDVFVAQKEVLGTALFVGVTVWGVLSSFFYVAERKNPDMIYCGAAPDCDDVDTGLCTTDEWGVVDCSAAGCPNDDDDGGEVCWNLYRSIVDASFWTLMELFGEFPLVDQHSAWGKVLGTFTAVFAVAVFALPVGVIANGFEDQISRRRVQKESQAEAADDEDSFAADESTFRGRVYNFLHREHTPAAKKYFMITRVMVIACAVAFMFWTVEEVHGWWRVFLGLVQYVTFSVFTVEYILVIYAAGENPKLRGQGLLSHLLGFKRVVDFISVIPYWIGIAGGTPGLLLLFKILNFERHSRAFSTFNDVLRETADVLVVTGFSALLLWIFFASILYYTERGSLDEEMSMYYKTIPDAMWITLLNLSGECPLAHYSNVGKVVVGIIGVFATAVFGVPIGLLGAGFEELVTSENVDTPDREVNANQSSPTRSNSWTFETACYQFANGIGSSMSTMFELSIYALIAATVTVGIIQTVPGYEDAFSKVELVAVLVFTFEYLIRFVGAGADPEFSNASNPLTVRIRYLFSFYSIIDLLAIVPFYLAYYMPNSWIDAHDEYFRMCRVMRLLKLDKYVPSISLVDDVFRLKRKVLTISCFAAGTLWILFSAAMYVAERDDDSIEIDPLPLYGCAEGCSMSDRFFNIFASIPLTGIHLTGDFPMVEYGSWGRFILFFIVIAAVGVVSIPSGVMASGFSQIVQSKTKGNNPRGDDWYDVQYQLLEGSKPPQSIFGLRVDAMQISVKEYLDGKSDGSRSQLSKIGRLSFFSLIIANVVAVILESVPEIDERVGNSRGNFFDMFEAWSVFFFTIDYILRLFSARKSREALYSPWVYSITFFGIVDLVSIFPWYIQIMLATTGHLNGDEARIFRIFRIFRVLQLEDFVIAFSKLDNVFRASKDVLKATGLMAVIIWVGASALFFIFEENNPNFRQCDDSIPPVGTESVPGCYDFNSTAACNAFYPDMCHQVTFTNMPNTMFYVSVFLGGDWGAVDFTWQGKLVCMFLCVAGIALYSIPVGTLFDAFAGVVGLGEEDDD